MPKGSDGALRSALARIIFDTTKGFAATPSAPNTKKRVAPISIASLLGDMLEMTRSSSQRCSDCGKESCSGQCRRERPTERPPASANRIKPRAVSDTLPDVVDDGEDNQDDEELPAEGDSSPDNAMQK